MFEKIKAGFSGKILDANCMQDLIKAINTKFGTNYQGLVEIKDNVSALKLVINDLVAKGL